MTVLVAPVSSIRLPVTLRLSSAETIADRPANCTGTITAPRGAAVAEPLGIGIAMGELSCGSDLKKRSSFFD
jgi:hypothetical protein